MEDDYCMMEKVDLKKNIIEGRESYGSIDSNWENYPRFGDYYDLCKKKRE
jgi:hypothetical protein